MVNMKYSIIPKKNKKMIYEYLFKEGVIVVKKDAKMPKHEEIDVPNLHVMMVLRSLDTLNYVDEKFTWRHHYYILNAKGIEFLRNYLSLSPKALPATMTKKAPPARPQTQGGPSDGYKGGPPRGFQPTYEGGAGRGYGRGRPPMNQQ
eukprot:Platyproteum_vivax@DN6009_c0_g1_i1.p1